MEVENFAGSKDKRGLESVESTFSFSQTIELGDKRLKRLQAAHLDASLAAWDYEVVRAQVAAQTAVAYVEIIAAQDRANVLNEFVAIAAKTQSSVDARVKGGKASPIELDRAIVATARAKAQVKAERARLEAAKRRLSVFWGAEHVDFVSVAGRLGRTSRVPSLASLKGLIERNPTLARWADEVGRRIAQLDVEVSKSIPDLTVGAGVRQFNDNDSVAAVASVSIPLPIFDRNSGNIIAAEQRIAKAERDHAAARTELLGTLVEALGELEIAATQLRAFETDVLPPAQSAFDRTKIGYEEGKFDILNVLDAQRSVFETKLDLISARAEYEKARVKLEAIAGRDLNGI
jgi:cobalt-zinc-cadmium efflux system outer membrane protein